MELSLSASTDGFAGDRRRRRAVGATVRSSTSPALPSVDLIGEEGLIVG
jgi:hypothetical protein